MRPAEEALATFTIAAVPKRASELRRQILMVCPFNDAAVSVKDLLGQEDFYGLRGAGALAQLHAADDVLHLASADESNVFTYVEVPEAWTVMQAGPRVQARELPASRVRGRWAPSRWLH